MHAIVRTMSLRTRRNDDLTTISPKYYGGYNNDISHIRSWGGGGDTVTDPCSRQWYKTLKQFLNGSIIYRPLTIKDKRHDPTTILTQKSVKCIHIVLTLLYDIINLLWNYVSLFRYIISRVVLSWSYWYIHASCCHGHIDIFTPQAFLIFENNRWMKQDVKI